MKTLILAAMLAMSATVVRAGAYPGPVNEEGHIHYGEVIRYKIHFHGHNHIDVHPDRWLPPGVDLDLRIVDRRGRIVAEDRRPNAGAKVHFDGTGDFWVEIRLHGAAHADFHLHTD